MGYRVAKRGRHYWLFGRMRGIRLDSSLRTTVKKEAEEIAKEKVRRTLARVHGGLPRRSGYYIIVSGP